MFLSFSNQVVKYCSAREQFSVDDILVTFKEAVDLCVFFLYRYSVTGTWIVFNIPRKLQFLISSICLVQRFHPNIKHLNFDCGIKYVCISLSFREILFLPLLPCRVDIIYRRKSAEMFLYLRALDDFKHHLHV